MPKALLSSVPAVAHVLTLAPLARALLRAGHEVAMVSGSEVAPLLPPGVTLLPAGLDLGAMLAESEQRKTSEERALDTGERRGVDAGIGRFFGGVRVELTIDEARAAAGAFAPDVVVGEGLDGVGPVLAAERGVPLVTVSLGPVCSAEIDRGVRDHLATRGFEAVEPDVRLDPWPVSLRPPGWLAPGPSTPLRAELGLAPGTGAAVPLPAGDAPCVLLTLGTLFARADGLQHLLDALLAAGLRVVCAPGPTVGADELTLPEGASLLPFGPLDAALEAVDAVVCHGGAATLLSALSCGRPVVVLPLGADHFANADGVRAAGVGRVVDELDAAAVAARAREVVEDPVTGAAARALAAEIASSPSPDDVVRERM